MCWEHFFAEAEVMSDRYLVKCDCGRELLVETAQAGRRLTCACGAAVEAPTLRQLKKLPVAPADYVPERPTWTWEKAAMFVGVLLLAGSVVFGAALYFNQPVKPREQIAAMEKQGAERLRTELKTARPMEVIGMFNQLAKLDLAKYAAALESHSAFEDYRTKMKAHESWVVFGWCTAGLGVVVVAATNILSGARKSPKAKPAAAPRSKARSK
jgi:hypothetical protein